MRALIRMALLAVLVCVLLGSVASARYIEPAWLGSKARFRAAPPSAMAYVACLHACNDALKKNVDACSSSASAFRGASAIAPPSLSVSTSFGALRRVGTGSTSRCRSDAQNKHYLCKFQCRQGKA